MSTLVPPDEIEKIVGVPRHPYDHWGILRTEDQRFYVLHSAKCRDEGGDLRDCKFSIALDQGIPMEHWERYEDIPVRLWINPTGWRLMPGIED